METNKSKSVYEHLDEQDKKLDDIRDKLDEPIQVDPNYNYDIDGLYSLARKTFENKDWVGAAKYYEHISVLEPTDWLPSYYAALSRLSCGINDYELPYGIITHKNCVLSTLKSIENDVDPLLFADFIKDEMRVLDWLHGRLGSSTIIKKDQFIEGKKNCAEILFALLDKIDNLNLCVDQTEELATKGYKFLTARNLDLSSDCAFVNKKYEIYKKNADIQSIMDVSGEEQTIDDPEICYEIISKGRAYRHYDDDTLLKRSRAIYMLVAVFAALCSLSALAVVAFQIDFPLWPLIINALICGITCLNCWNYKNDSNMKSLFSKQRIQIIKLKTGYHCSVHTSFAFVSILCLGTFSCMISVVLAVTLITQSGLYSFVSASLLAISGILSFSNFFIGLNSNTGESIYLFVYNGNKYIANHNFTELKTIA